MNAAIIELNALADANGAAADDHRLIPLQRPGLVLLLVGAVEIGRLSSKLSGTGIHQLIYRQYLPPVAQLPDLLRQPVGQGPYLLIGEAEALCLPHELGGELF